jgi:hypothetical protein
MEKKSMSNQQSSFINHQLKRQNPLKIDNGWLVIDDC